ncbi:hypothetical protein JGU66_08550 [Myxococcaceae bacterium JPH2]|nr:hypothetical protein [Myxococcaceae bacterium JPH2]
MRLTWLGLMGALVACASTGYRYVGPGMWFGQEEAQVWVKGPWPAIRPSRDVDDVIDQLCGAILEMDGARDGDYGQECCGVLYSIGDGNYFASYPSPLGEVQRVGPSKRKVCTSPRTVRDSRGRVSGLADYHGHPWAPSPMSEQDRQESHQRWFIRIQFDSDCHVMKLIPHVGESAPGEVYLRKGKSWRLIGSIRPEDKARGVVTDVKD